MSEQPKGTPRPVPILDPEASERAETSLAVRVDEPMVMDIRRSLPLAKAQFEAIREFVKDVLVVSVQEDKANGVDAVDGDYGTIPGVRKPFLFKSGAEKIAALFGYAPVYVTLERIEDWGERKALGFFFYRYRCDLVSKKSGNVMGSGIGSCNSMEDRYRWINPARKCPTCGAEAIKRSQFSDGWYCHEKVGGCNAKFAKGDDSIESQVIGRVERETFSLVNTIDKMAQKRALVAAVLIGTGTSALFTQDEDAVERPEGAPAKTSVTLATTSATNEAPKPTTNGHGPVAPNLYAGACLECGQTVAEKAGVRVRDASGKWGAQHSAGGCPKPEDTTALDAEIEGALTQLHYTPSQVQAAAGRMSGGKTTDWRALDPEKKRSWLSNLLDARSAAGEAVR